MKDRIKQIMESRHMSQQEFAGLIKLSPAALSGIFNERTKPTLNTIEAIKTNIPEISLDWLMIGKGDMYELQDGTLPDGEVVKEPARTMQTDLFRQSDRPINSAAQQGSLKYLDKSTGDREGTTGDHNAAIKRVPSSGRLQGYAPTLPSEGRVNEVKGTPLRKITEIRVFYDDQTFESFLPKK